LVYSNKAVIGIGGNKPSSFGDCDQTLLESVRRIKSLQSVEVVAQSAIYKSKAWPPESNQSDYANMAVLITVTGSAHDLLGACQKIENDMGRIRKERWGARVIDLDLLAFDDSILPNIDIWRGLESNEDPSAFVEDVTVPHPRLHKRPFAMIPFSEVYPDWIHPVFGQTSTALAECLSRGENHQLELYNDN